jgi:hypothetical protein
LRPLHLHAGFLDEDGGQNEENEKDENDINQGGDIDLFRLGVAGVKEAALFHEGKFLKV